MPEGEIGELVITSLQMEGMPLIRYRTGDVSFLVPGACPCGRGGDRIGPILGRKQHRLKVKGTTLYPKTIEDALVAVEGVENFVIEARNGGWRDGRAPRSQLAPSATIPGFAGRSVMRSTPRPG